MHRLVDSMPVKADRIDGIRSGLMQKAFTNRATFRSVASQINSIMEAGYTKDPSEMMYQAYQKLTFDDIDAFYKSRLSGKPVVIAIAGDTRKFDRKALERWGKVIEVKRSQVIRN